MSRFHALRPTTVADRHREQRIEYDGRRVGHLRRVSAGSIDVEVVSLCRAALHRNGKRCPATVGISEAGAIVQVGLGNIVAPGLTRHSARSC